MKPVSPARLARMRLAAQRLTPATAAAGPVEAARAVLGIQAQDLRAMGLALRSRVPGIERSAIPVYPDLVRTWTVRGTAHLVAADDLPWLHTLTAARNRHRFELLIEARDNLDRVRAQLADIVEILDGGPLTRAEVLSRMAERGLAPLGSSTPNILIPWVASQGLLRGLPDGRFGAAEPPPAVEEDEALATLGRRYLAGYGPAGAPDLARWSGLPITMARRALDAAGSDVERAGDLLALPGTLDGDPPAAPSVLLLAPFDTSMLGWRNREPLVATADDAHVLPGGGIIRAAVLARGRATATWRLDGSGRRRKLVVESFGRAAASAPLQREATDVGRFLGFELDPAS